MIPKLLDYEKTLQALVNDQTEGLGRLPEATVCKVTEERNGAYYLEMTLPIEAKHYKDITLGGIILAKPNTTDNPQMFRIAKVTRPLNGLVQIRANHISYDLNKTSVLPFSATGAPNTVRLLKENMTGGAAFTFSTTITNSTSAFNNAVPQSARALMGGQQGSLLDVFGGEYRYNGLTVSLMQARGENRGVRIAYGKNLTDIKQEEAIEKMYTAVVPFATTADSVVIGDTITMIEVAEPKILNLDLSSSFQSAEAPTKAEVNQAAAAYIKANNLTEPTISIDVSFVNLADTEEYKNVAPLERVSLCDTVTVYFEKLNISASAKVNKTVYDVLAERYQSIELGNARASLASTINNSIAAVKEEVEEQKNFIGKAIDHATSLITGGLGGYVLLKPNAAGQPEEILIMDTDNPTTAMNVIRMNRNGIGFSNTGYNGPFTTAWTIDGGFVADFIKSGTIEAINIVGSLIKGSTIIFGDDTSKQVTVSSLAGGMLFSGDGDIRFSTAGQFDLINNYKNGNVRQAANKIQLSTVANSTGLVRRESAFQNFDGTGTQLANGFWLLSDDIIGTNQATLHNYRNNKIQNGIGLVSRDNETSSLISNQWPGQTYDASYLKMITGTDTTSIYLGNNRANETTLASYLNMETNSSKTQIKLGNVWPGTNRTSSELRIGTESASSEIGMYTYNSSGGIIGSISAGQSYYNFGVYGGTQIQIDTAGRLIVNIGGTSHYVGWENVECQDGYYRPALVAY